MAKRADDNSELRGLNLVVTVTVVKRECLSDLLTLLGGELLNV